MPVLKLLAAAVLAVIPLYAVAVELPKATPESQGLDSARLVWMLDYLQGNGFDADSVLLARHGKLVLEAYVAPFHAGIAHQINSATKSFTSTLAGIAIAEGKLSLDDTVAKVLPQYDDLPNAHLITLRQLLGMQSGVMWNDEQDMRTMHGTAPDWGRMMLQHPRPAELVGKWNYNSAGSYLIGLMVAQALGQPLADYAQQKLFGPLGFGKVDWDKDPQGRVDGSRGIYADPHDLLAFAELFRQGGRFDGQQRVPQQWVDYATSPLYPLRPDTSSDAYYGAQWWTTRNGDWYAAQGGGGQYVAVLPKDDISLVITSRAYAFKWGPQPDFSALIQYFIRPLLEQRPDDPTATIALNARIAQLANPPRDKPVHSPLEASLNGKTIKLQDNARYSRIKLSFADDHVLVDETGLRSAWQLNARMDGTWNTQTVDSTLVASRAHWRDDHTLVFERVLVREGLPETLTFSFSDGHVHIDIKDQAAGLDGVLTD